jgi:Protein of unknown function with HXXEE motif
MPLLTFAALYLLFPIVLAVHNLDEYRHARGLPPNPRARWYSSYLRGHGARVAMIVLTAAAAVVAVLNYTSHTKALTAAAELSVFALLFNAVGHILLSLANHAWQLGARSAAFLVLPYSLAVIAVMASESGQSVVALWPVAVGGLIFLPAAILVALAIARAVCALAPTHGRH